GQLGGDRARVEPEEITDRIRVLAAIEPRERLHAGIRRRFPRAVELALEPGGEAVEHLGLRAGRVERRHEARADLADGRLPNLGVPPEIGAIDPLEREIPRAVDVVVTRDAIALEDLPLGVRPGAPGPRQRSEERRVGKVWRSRCTEEY